MRYPLCICFSIVGLAWHSSIGQARLVGLPTVPFNSSGSGTLAVAEIKAIHVDPSFANTFDSTGETLIPPTLLDFANTFSEDLQTLHKLNTSVHVRPRGSAKSILLTIDNSTIYTDAAGRSSSEGYSINISSSGVVISGASPLGTWWGTRTLLQQIVLGNGTLPYGSGSDTPGWGTRGFMLDSGRHFYPVDFVTDLCSYMSYFKQNTLHLHLSDNLYNNLKVYSRNDTLNLYARFRLWSEDKAIEGLNKHQNESYTREEFDEIQQKCVSRGVTIIPELEAPGHALVVTQWKPELGLSDLSLLNISNPDAIPTMQTVWSTFLDWFHVKTVHIGADEYTGSAAEYTTFVNAMAGYIGAVSDKYIRIWGTFTPNATNGYPYKNITVQHWEYFEADPYVAYMEKNYSVINSDDYFYTVNKYSTSYPHELDPELTFSVPIGGAWYPYVFNTKNASDNPLSSSPLVMGSIAALWNDYGPNPTTFAEAYFVIRQGLPALADKQWGGDLTSNEFHEIFDILHASIPAQNLDRSIPSKTSTILEYNFGNSTAGGLIDKRQHQQKRVDMTTTNTTILDLSGNNYHGTSTCPLTANGTLPLSESCSLLTPLSSKGRDYTLTIDIKISSILRTSITPLISSSSSITNNSSDSSARLISGLDSSLYILPSIGLASSNGYFYSVNSTFTTTLDKWFTISLFGRGNQTFVALDGGKEEEIQTTVDVNGVEWVQAPIAIEAPLAVFGGVGCGFLGELRGVKLVDYA